MKPPHWMFEERKGFIRLENGRGVPTITSRWGSNAYTPCNQTPVAAFRLISQFSDAEEAQEVHTPGRKRARIGQH